MQVPPDRSKQLIEAFHPSSCSVYEHSGAHLVPTCSGAFKQAVVAFLDGQAGVQGEAADGGPSEGAVEGEERVVLQQQRAQTVAA